MMHNTYGSYSSIIALRTTYFPFNDYSCCYPNDKCPSNYYCSCCCSFTVNSSRLMLPMNINPSILYGLRQSTLIQCPPSRRVILGSNDRYRYRSSIYDVGCCCCHEFCCGKKGRVVGRSCNEKGCVEMRKSEGVDRVLGRSCKERCCVKESKSKGVDKIRGRVIRRERDFRCNALDNAEAMLSLLSEEGIEECVLIRDKRKSASKDARLVKEQNVAIVKCKDVKGNVFLGSGYFESKSKKQQLKSSRDRYREEGHKRREERESNLIDEDRRLRRKESGSSYYSLSNLGEFGSDSEVDVKQDGFVGESLTRQEKDSRKTGAIVISEVTNDFLESSKNEKDQQLISSRCDNVRVGSPTEWDWRKKSEKKLTDESAEVTRSKQESILRQSKMSQVNENSSIMASSSKKQFSNIEEKSMSDMSSHRQSRSSTRKDNKVSEYTKSSGQHEQSLTDLRFHENSKYHVKIGNQVSEHLVSGRQHEQSSSGVSSSGQLKSQITIDNQASEYLKSSQHHEQSLQTNRKNVESTSTTTKRPVQGKGAMVIGQSVQETGCDYCRTCGRSVQESKIESDTKQRSELSEIHGDARWTTTVQSHSESGHRKQEMGTSSSLTLVEEESKEWDKLHFAAGQVDARMISGQNIETLDYDDSYDQSTLRIQKQQEMRKKLDTSTSFKSPHDVKKLEERLGDRVIKETESHKLLQTEVSNSRVRSTDVDINRHSASDKRINDEQTYSTSKLKSVKELVEKHKLVDETFMQTRLRTEVQGPVLQVGLTGNFSGEPNTSRSTLGSTSKTGAQQVSEIEVKSDLQLSVTSPSFQLIERISSDSEPEGSVFRECTGSPTEVDRHSGYSQPHATRSSSSDEANQSGSRLVEELESAISSVERMHESYTQIVSEFVEKTRHDSSASETILEKEPSQVERTHMLAESTLPHPEEATFVKQDSILVSGGSGTKELLDVMWDAKDHSVEEVSESESELLEAEISENVVASRTGKSLWNIVDGLFRLRRGSVSETQKSSVKSSQQSSSNDSATGETWFSGNEHDEGTGDSMKSEPITLSQGPTSSNQPLSMITASRSRHGDLKKKRSISMPHEPTSELPLLGENASKSRKKDHRKKDQRNLSQEPALDRSLHQNKIQKGDSRLMSLDDQRRPVKLFVLSSASASQGGSVSGSVSIGANTDFKMTQQTSQPSPSSPLTPSAGRLRRSDALKGIEEFQKIEERISSTGEQRESSPHNVLVPSARQLIRSDAFEDTEEAGRGEDLISSTSESKGHSLDVMESGVPNSEEIDTELKRRKLQRSKQVLSDRFDEWEDAYRRENEQRKVDEIFMREALAEAIKAADSWEVPVGAVLVQNGKIIARGYNLVEELRDSTAHAEMICIREASNVLRTWRLSETTLYVTLEPCPMCAGAILQARIGTLVWGAPNKLSGADGSWIRLFPEGVEGEQRSEVTDKPTAPVHPFHPKMKIRRGVLDSECAQIMQQFFQLRRKKEKEKQKNSEEEGQPSCLPIPHNPTKLLRKMHGVFHVM